MAPERHRFNIYTNLPFIASENEQFMNQEKT
jgi:hypothetical protein